MTIALLLSAASCGEYGYHPHYIISHEEPHENEEESSPPAR